MRNIRNTLYTALTASIALVSQALAGLLPVEQDIIHVFNNVSPYVVNVHQTENAIDRYWHSKKVVTGTGSGIVLNPNGLIVTNYHVLGQHKQVDVVLKNGKNYIADFIGGDPRKDVAVLRLRNTSALRKMIHNKPLQMANSEGLRVGQIAIAIGNPFGLDETLTEGVISALDREIFGYGGVAINGMIQTDASINPGNSGGPLLDSRGRLIGMNTMIYSRTGAFSGIGFAIPSNTIHRIATQIIEHGKVITPGIGIVPVPDTVALQSGVQGVIIASVVPNMPASKAGLKGVSQTYRGQYRLGDVIVGVNGKPIKTFNDLYQVLDKQKIGDDVTLTILRNGERHQVKVKTVNVT